MAQPARPGAGKLHLRGQLVDEPRLLMFWRRFRRNRMALFGLGVLLVLAAMAIGAPWVAPEKWDYLDLLAKNQPPSHLHWFGTDMYGRDLFSRIVWGARISLSVGFVAAGVAVVLGAVWGAVAGYHAGSWLDVTMMRIAEAVDSVPVLILLVVISSVVSRSVYTVMVIIGLTSWPGLASLVRGQFLSLRQRDFVQAAQAMGASDRRIIFRHILPNVVAVILVSATLRIGDAILAETALNFIGYGAPPPFPTWGEALSTGRMVLRQAPWVATIPGLFITITVLAFNFVGDGLRDAQDPHLNR